MTHPDKPPRDRCATKASGCQTSILLALLEIADLPTKARIIALLLSKADQ